MYWPAFHFPTAASITYIAIIYEPINMESLFMFVPSL